MRPARRAPLLLVVALCGAVFCPALAASLEEADKLLMEGRTTEARAMLEELAKDDKTAAAASNKLAAIALAEGDKKAMVAHLEQATGGDDSPALLTALAWGYVEQNEPDKAFQTLEKLAAKLPAREKDIQLARARLLQKQGKIAEAGELLKALIAKDKTKNASLNKEYAVALYEGGKFPEALEALSLAMKTTPNDPEIFLLQGHIYAAMKDYRRAIGAYERARAAGRPDALVPLVLSAANQGDYQIVRRYWNDFIKFPESAPYREALRRNLDRRPRPAGRLQVVFQRENDQVDRLRFQVGGQVYVAPESLLTAYADQGRIEFASFADITHRRDGIGFYHVVHPLSFYAHLGQNSVSGFGSKGDAGATVRFSSGANQLTLSAGSYALVEGMTSQLTLSEGITRRPTVVDFRHKLRAQETFVGVTLARETFSDGNRRDYRNFYVDFPAMQMPVINVRFGLHLDKYDRETPLYYSVKEVRAASLLISGRVETRDSGSVRYAVKLLRSETASRDKESDFGELAVDYDYPINEKQAFYVSYHGLSSPTYFFQTFLLGMEQRF